MICEVNIINKTFIKTILILAVIWSVFFFAFKKIPYLDVNVLFNDLMYQAKALYFPSDTPTEDIVIVDINDKALWIIQRPDYLAKLIKTISVKGGAKIIGVDILFDDLKHPDPPEKTFKDIPLDCSPERGKTHEEMELACVIQSNEVSDVILAVFSKKIAKGKHSFIYPVKALMQATSGLGYVNNPMDKDGIHRRSYIWVDDKDTNKSVFTMPTVIAYSITGSRPQVDSKNKDIINFNNNQIHKLDKDSDQFNILPELLGPSYKFKYITVKDIRDHRFDEKYLQNLFNDKIVFIGTTSLEQQDLKRTPFTRFNQNDKLDGLMPGVEFHANTLLSLLHNKLYNYLPLWVDILWAIVFVLLSVYFMLHTRLILATFLNVILVIVSFVIAFIIFLNYYLILQSLGSTIVTMLLAVPVCYTFRYLQEKRERHLVETDKKHLMKLFDRYVSPDVANLI
ncbi:MAG: CHASE2 domain-containing protein, partial [Vampirovibrionia bacterium]